MVGAARSACPAPVTTVLPALQASFQEPRSGCTPGLNSAGERAQVRPRRSREHRRSRYLADAVAGSVARDALVHAGQDGRPAGAKPPDRPAELERTYRGLSARA